MRRTGLWGLLAWALLAAAAAGPAGATGFLVPKDEGIPPLAIKYLRVDTTIDNQVATTRIVQEFQNSTGRDLECTYIFPLPEGAAIRDFAMYIGGKRMKGELLEKDRARQVFEEIVRRMKDPGLLEYIDCQVLRMRIYPVPANGTQKVELEYTEVVPMDEGLAEYVFPLRTGDRASRTLEDFTVAVRIKSDVPLKSVYSPTHEVGVSRPSDHEAVAGVETKAALLDKDFHLFYAVGKKDFGLNLMTYRPDPKEPGMFLILLSPGSETGADQRVPRDLLFVLDTSGSMKGEKIEQAKKALKFCIEKLEPQDRFAIVQFSTVAQAFPDAGKWADASAESKARAAAWIDSFEAAGGTNIGEALDLALGLPLEDARPATVLFLTDGRPTVNVTDIEALSQKAKEKNKRNLRFFTFGVGDDVNTKLLDRLSGETGGLPEYIRPDEPIDGKVTRLFVKMIHPVLVNLELEIPGVKVTEMYPRPLPDLFRGSQLVLVGSYTGSGDSVIRLKGKVQKKAEEFVYEGTFPEKAVDRSFIGPLFAHRKIGYLLDEIRLHGESQELRDEVVRLSLKYGIETPYTSYLVLESEQQYKQYGIARNGYASNAGAGGPAATPSAPSDARRAEDVDRSLKATFGNLNQPPPGSRSASKPAAQHPYGDAAAGGKSGEGAARESAEPAAGLRFDRDAFEKADTGKDAVDIAEEVSRLKRADNLSVGARGRQAVEERAGRRLAKYRGVWVDEAFKGAESLVKVKWGSEAYFALVRAHPELKEIFSLGQRLVLVTAEGKALVVDTEGGAEEMSDEAMKGLFTAAAKETPQK